MEALKIETINERELLINGKRVAQDMEGNWVAHHELTSRERWAFSKYITAKRRSPGGAPPEVECPPEGATMGREN